MLTLIFPKTSLTSASIPVRWCVDEVALDVATSEGLNPYILIRMEYHSGHSPSFKLYPLDQFSAYLDVHHPGQVDIQAFLVTSTQNNKEAIRRTLMSGGYDRETAYAFNKYTIHFGTATFRKMYTIKTFDASEEHSFEIDPSFFGKELPESVKFFVNRYWYQEKPVDECAQRRRLLLFPFTTLLPVLAEATFRWLWNFIGCIWFWSILVGARPGHLLHPFDDIMDKYDVQKMPNLYDWFSKSKYKDSMVMVIGLFPFIPLVYIISVGLVYWRGDYSLLQSLYAGPGWLYLIVSIITIFAAFVYLVFYVPGKWIGKHAPDWIAELSNAIAERFWINLDKFLDWMERVSAPSERKRELLLCHDKNGECLPALTFKDKSVKLIFADIKNKVCRPMRG